MKIKKILYFKFLLLYFLTTFLISSEDIKSGIITYKIEGTYENGVEVVFFDGEKKAIYTHSRISLPNEDEEVLSDTLKIINNGENYIIDLLTKTGKKILFSLKDYENLPLKQKQNFKNKAILPLLELSDKYINKNISSTNNKVKFFGKNCDVISSTFFKSYYWKNILLRQSITLPFKILREVTNLEINVPISSDRFIPPKDISISYLTNKEKEDTNQMLKKLLENINNK